MAQFPVGKTQEEFEANVDGLDFNGEEYRRLEESRKRSEEDARRRAANAWEKERASHSVACERVKVKRCPARVPTHYLETLEHNQKLHSCCRNPQEHEIEAWFSDAVQKRRGVPDIYIFHCTCGRKHRRFCVGGGDTRPFWQVR